MLPLRLLRPDLPSRLVVASARRAPLAWRRQECVGDLRRWAGVRWLRGGGTGGFSPKTPRPDRSCVAGGERLFSSRDDNDGRERLHDVWSSSSRLTEEPEPGAAESSDFHHVSGTTPIEAVNDPIPPPPSPSAEEGDLSNSSNSDYVLKESARVHPISQLVLLFFQTDEGYEWMSKRGVASSTLRIHDDGTFALTFPSEPIIASREENPLVIGEDPPAQIPDCRIWTQYDKGRHWLCVSVRDMASRFLLQDCSWSATSKFRGRRAVKKEEEDTYTPWKVGIHAHPKPTLADHVEDAVRAAMREVDGAPLTK